MVVVFASGAHRHLSLETLVRHRMAIDAFIDAPHASRRSAAFIAIYIVVVALSIPGALFLTITGGILFGTLVGGAASVVGATTGATIIFLVARSACGESLVRRAGPLACKLADGLSRRRVQLPAVPAAGAGVSVLSGQSRAGAGRREAARPSWPRPRSASCPATFAFAFFGSGLDSVLAAQEGAYRACLAAGRTDCPIQFDLGVIVTPQLLAALAALGALALIPVLVKRLRARHARSSPAPLT